MRVSMEEPVKMMTRTRSRDASGHSVLPHSSSSGDKSAGAPPSLHSSSSSSSSSASSSSLLSFFSISPLPSPITSSHSPFRHRLQFALAVTLLLAFAFQLSFADSPPEIPFDLVSLHHEGKWHMHTAYSRTQTAMNFSLRVCNFHTSAFTTPHSRLGLLLIYVHCANTQTFIV